MTRKLVAAYACRSGGSRLFGKPLQNLEPGHTILDQLIQGTKKQTIIEEIVLGVAEGVENAPYYEYAKKYGLSYITGNEKDVLYRLIMCGRVSKATDVFRVTTECPFPAWEMLEDLWSEHLNKGNDITVTDYLPEGMNFEIYRLEALEKSHSEGTDEDRSEYCSAYPRRNSNKFKIGIVEAKKNLQRLDLRLTVDNPEDLILCSNVYKNLKIMGPCIPANEIIKFVDTHQNLHNLVKPYIDMQPLWAGIVK